jgi:hypothetical protein
MTSNAVHVLFSSNVRAAAAHAWILRGRLFGTPNDATMVFGVTRKLTVHEKKRKKKTNQMYMKERL